MSSAHKKNLTVGATTAKGAGATVTGDTIVIPPDSEELLLAITADDSISGAVKATLEISADGVNWAEAQTSTGASGGGVPARLSIDNVDNQSDNNIVTTPALNAAQYTDVCRVSFAGALEALDAEYSITLSGDDAASYRLNNVTSGDVSAPVTAQFEDDVVLETASTFAFTATGYNHDVTITVVEDQASSTDTVELNCTRTVPATMANGSVAAIAGDSADGVDVCTLTPGGGPTGCTYSLAITGTDAAYYRIHNTTAGTKSDDGAPLKTLSGIALGNSVVLETDELLAIPAGATHSVTITNTESSTGNTASVTVSITVNAVITFSNDRYVAYTTAGSLVDTVSVDFETDFSLSFWMKSAGDYNQSYQNAFYFGVKYGTGTDAIGAYARRQGLAIQYRGNAYNFISIGSAYIAFADPGIDDTNWHHIALVWDAPASPIGGIIYHAHISSHCKLYVDGSLISLTGGAGGGDTNSAVALNGIQISDWVTNSVEPIVHIDDVCFWDGTALSSGNVSSIYNSGTPIAVTGIDGLADPDVYWLFEDAGNITYDEIGEANTGTSTNGTSTTH